MQIPKHVKWIAVAITLALVGVVLFFTFPAEVHPALYDHSTLSKNVNADIHRMWETRLLAKTNGSSQGTDSYASTDGAINAALRVFNSVDLIGKSTQEVIDLFGDPRTSNNSMYNFSFWPSPESGLVYRFDSAAYGWQFNVVTKEDIVISVDRKWIH